jgi:hypothetical protein
LFVIHLYINQFSLMYRAVDLWRVDVRTGAVVICRGNLFTTTTYSCKPEQRWRKIWWNDVTRPLRILTTAIVVY